MGQVAQTLGVGPEIEFEGRVYRVAPITYELQARFETFLERRAVQAVQRLKPAFSDAEYDRAMAACVRDVAAGVYSFGGEACVQASKSLHGLKELLRLCLNRNHPEVDAEFVDRMFDAKAQELAEALTAANPDPLADAPPRTAGAG